MRGRVGDRRVTIGILIAVGLALVAWDVYAYLGTGPSATISRVMLDWAGRWPIVPFGAGVLAGHLFWPQRQR